MGGPVQRELACQNFPGSNHLTMFIIDLTYQAPIEAIEKALPEHVAYLENHYQAGHFIASGRKVPRSGGVIIARGISREELEELVKEDPFIKEGLAQVQITEFSPTKYHEHLKELI